MNRIIFTKQRFPESGRKYVYILNFHTKIIVQDVKLQDEGMPYTAETNKTFSHSFQ